MTSRTVIGHVSSVRGLDGELKIYTAFEFDSTDLKKMKTVFLADSILTVRAARLKPPHLLLKLENILDRNGAEKCVGVAVSLPGDVIKTEPGERIFLRELLDFEVFDGDHLVGRVIGISTNTAQDLLVIQDQDTKFEVPLVEAFVRRINWETKTIFCNLPEGLIP